MQYAMQVSLRIAYLPRRLIATNSNDVAKRSFAKPHITRHDACMWHQRDKLCWALGSQFSIVSSSRAVLLGCRCWDLGGVCSTQRLKLIFECRSVARRLPLPCSLASLRKWRKIVHRSWRHPRSRTGSRGRQGMVNRSIVQTLLALERHRQYPQHWACTLSLVDLSMDGSSIRPLALLMR